MPETIIIDTNVLLFDPKAIYSFPACNIIIPLSVIQELDKFKHDQTETGRNARDLAVLVDGLRVLGPLRFGVKLPNDATVTIMADVQEEGHEHRTTASRILALAKAIAQNTDPTSIRIITKNISLRLLADSAGFTASDMDSIIIRGTEAMRGWHVINASAPQVENLREGRCLPPSPNIDWHPNEYAFVRDREDPRHAVCARFHGDDGMLWPLINTERIVCGIRSLNIEQTFALDALLDDSIKLVTLAGKAGTGKTLLSIAAGLHQVFSDARYSKLTIFRPTMPVSRDLGYLPGDLGEKMRPWMQPVFDALEFIRQQDRKSPMRSLPNDLMSCPEISIDPLTYIRGRSIPHQFIIIDETQNLTPLEVKTAVTRCGAESKIIVTGDPEQIDTPYVDAISNGLTRIVEKFLSSPLSAHITLQKGERSELAETAAKLL
ncbi:MAG: PhoH family protein [Victivallales bacterium]|nr:PhoH family protein [Victivallales bacterium]